MGLPTSLKAPAGLAAIRGTDRLGTVWLAMAAGLPALIGLSACGDFGAGVLTDRIPPYVVPADKPANPIERALAYCKEKTEAEETRCVKAGLSGSNVSMTGLVAMIPKCQRGRVCDYKYTTKDRLGYLAADAADFTVHWQVEIDFRSAHASVADLPVTVTQVGS